ncbi:TrmH family RNA methyltransferase [Candidatus Phytoplasma phoenicium]|uniref:SpoU RNA methylase n=1 Tax=Candidatus Phytoplasma phoenicium TaxID=198422 RepID=A0A0L0MIP1_9MOLU|nr:RNA methyltransferase [Candidatus Phytoplasma phoenicium]KND62557.1 SpoU RNA methylase [Candidatus Phytoplasma phoenicium]
MIVSENNHTFQKLKKLTMKKYRDFYQQFLIFGEHLIQEAEKKQIIINLYSIDPYKKGLLMKAALMKELHPQKILYPQVALCRMWNQPIISSKILVLDNIQDPGNAGVLLRSACAFGFKHVFFSHQSVDFYHEKTLRASQGALFHLFCERGILKNFLLSLCQKNYYIFSACVHQQNLSLKDVDIAFLKNHPQRILVVGNEGTGITPMIEQMSHYHLQIETTDVESLNVNVAGSILMYFLK